MFLQGKTILVTGGSRGIGRAIARKLAAEGARIILHFARNRVAAEATLGSLAGEGHQLAQADLASPDGAQTLFDTISALDVEVDGLVNNAGIFEDHAIDVVDQKQT